MSEKFISTLEQCSISSIYSDINNKDSQINLNAEYQRDVVWDDEKMRYFIDSINIGIIPTNLIFNINTDTGEKICIDGKQRITSIKRFMENDPEIYLTDVDEKRIYYSKIPEDIDNTRIFKQKEKTEFISRKIPVVTYTDLNYDE